MCGLKALRDSNPSGCEGELWQCNIDPGEDLCPAVLVKTRVCGGFSFSRAHKTSLRSILFCICREGDCPITSRDWDHLERLVRCVISIPLWGHFARAIEGDTRVSLSYTCSFLRPLLPSACCLGRSKMSYFASSRCLVIFAHWKSLSHFEWSSGCAYRVKGKSESDSQSPQIMCKYHHCK